MHATGPEFIAAQIVDAKRGLMRCYRLRNTDTTWRGLTRGWVELLRDLYTMQGN